MGYFGAALDILGSQVAIGAFLAAESGIDRGAVHLFDDTGTLLNTLITPEPDGNTQFGLRVELVGENEVIVGAPAFDFQGLIASGSTYLFAPVSDDEGGDSNDDVSAVPLPASAGLLLVSLGMLWRRRALPKIG